MISSIFSFLADVAPKGNDPDGAARKIQAIKALSSGPSSIYGKAQTTLFKFPFLVSNSMSEPAKIATIVKSGEIEYSNLILLTASINPYVNSDSNQHIRRSLSTFHSNNNNLLLESNDYVFKTDITSTTVEDALNSTILKPGAKPTINKEWIMGNESAYTSRKWKEGKDENEVEYTNDIIKTQDLAMKAMDANARNRDSHQKELDNRGNVAISDITNNVNKQYNSMFNMTMVRITMRAEDDKNDIVLPIGIKGNAHILPSEDICYLFETAITSGRGLLRWFQATSGEIKTVRDFLLQVDVTKQDAEFAKRTSYNSNWLAILKERNASAKTSAFLRLSSKGGNNSNLKELMPSCTVVLTLEDLDYIEDKTGINLFTKTVLLKKVMNQLMLLGVFIYDGGNDVVHVMYNGDGDWSSQPIRSMAKAPKSDGDMTDVLLNVMKRV